MLTVLMIVTQPSLSKSRTSKGVCSLICMLLLIHLVKILLSFSTISLAYQSITGVVRTRLVHGSLWIITELLHMQNIMQQSTLPLAKSIYVMILIGRNSAGGSCEILFCFLSIFCGHYISWLQSVCPAVFPKNTALCSFVHHTSCFCFISVFTKDRRVAKVVKPQTTPERQIKS